jgi:AhpD family alkylhydroperoxidase
MPRVTPIRAEHAPADLKDIYDRAPRLDDHAAIPEPSLFLSQIELLAHTPGILKGLTEVYRWFGKEGTVPRKYHELAIVMVSNLNKCTYCVSHHTPFALEYGALEDQVAAIQDGSWPARRDLFDEAEWTVLEYAERVTLESWKVPNELFDRLRRHFSESQIVELTARITLCSFWNKFNDALRLDLEPGVSEVAIPMAIQHR